MATEYTLIRHGNTGKAKTDKSRRLSRKGRAQAQVMRQKLGKFDLVLTSTAARARRTAQILVRPGAKIVKLEELYLPAGADNERMDKVFRRLGYAPLSLYLTKRGIRGTLERYVERAMPVIEKHATRHDAKQVLIVGHAVLLNALGHALAPDKRGARKFLRYSLKECEGFRIGRSGRVEILTNP